MGEDKRQQMSPQKVACTFELVGIPYLTDRDYSVYYIVSTSNRVGYLGIYPNGKFNYAIVDDDINKTAVLDYIFNYIEQELGLIPRIKRK